MGWGGVGFGGWGWGGWMGWGQGSPMCERMTELIQNSPPSPGRPGRRPFETFHGKHTFHEKCSFGGKLCSWEYMFRQKCRKWTPRGALILGHCLSVQTGAPNPKFWQKHACALPREMPTDIFLDPSHLVGDVFVYISFLRVAAANKPGNAEFASLAPSVSLAATRRSSTINA